MMMMMMMMMMMIIGKKNTFRNIIFLVFFLGIFSLFSSSSFSPYLSSPLPFFSSFVFLTFLLFPFSYLSIYLRYPFFPPLPSIVPSTNPSLPLHSFHSDSTPLQLSTPPLPSLSSSSSLPLLSPHTPSKHANKGESIVCSIMTTQGQS